MMRRCSSLSSLAEQWSDGTRKIKSSIFYIEWSLPRINRRNCRSLPHNSNLTYTSPWWLYFIVWPYRSDMIPFLWDMNQVSLEMRLINLIDVWNTHTTNITHPLFNEFSDFIGIEFWSKVPLNMDMNLILVIDDPSEYPAHFSITPS